MMTIDKFNYRYVEKGGYAQFYRMLIEEMKTHKEIAEHFGFSKTAASTYVIDLFPTFDSRFERRVRVINQVLDYLKNHSFYETKQAFKYIDKNYWKEAKFLADKMNLYKK